MCVVWPPFSNRYWQTGLCLLMVCGCCMCTFEDKKNIHFSIVQFITHDSVVLMYCSIVYYKKRTRFVLFLTERYTKTAECMCVSVFYD